VSCAALRCVSLARAKAGRRGSSGAGRTGCLYFRVISAPAIRAVLQAKRKKKRELYNVFFLFFFGFEPATDRCSAAGLMAKLTFKRIAINCQSVNLNVDRRRRREATSISYIPVAPRTADSVHTVHRSVQLGNGEEEALYGLCSSCPLHSSSTSFNYISTQTDGRTYMCVCVCAREKVFCLLSPGFARKGRSQELYRVPALLAIM
jgi:hypothetical protein